MVAEEAEEVVEEVGQTVRTVAAEYPGMFSVVLKMCLRRLFGFVQGLGGRVLSKDEARLIGHMGLNQLREHLKLSVDLQMLFVVLWALARLVSIVLFAQNSVV